MINIIKEIKLGLSLTDEELKQGIIGHTPGSTDLDIDISCWLEDDETVPKWATKAATVWVIELWMADRDACEPSQLLQVDKTYTRMLRGYSMAEVISFRNALVGQQ